MRLNCPRCGERDLKEFYYQGDAIALNRPDQEADETIWDDYLHNRDNSPGLREELWYHEAGCNAWLIVKRNTQTHEIIKTEMVAERVLAKGECS
ncbi:MAG: sarcosine oxidase subunit delta [Rhodobacteraceae bacterium]|nr:sarcosine oxidase subunit delta [Paracoccaceae bacterium]